MKVLYFSWIKDGIGKSQEDIILEEGIKTIADLIKEQNSPNDKVNPVHHRRDLDSLG